MALQYPETRRYPTTETLAGLTFPDPYRWLEADDDEVRSWQDAQNRLTDMYLEEWPFRAGTRELVDRFVVPRFVGVPRFAGGRWFRRGGSHDADHARVEIAESPTGPWRVLVDLDATTHDHPANVEWLSPSPDGHLVAYGSTVDGSERNTLHVLDVDGGSLLPDSIPQVLMDGWTGGVQWLTDSSGFFYTAIYRADTLELRLFFHRLGRPAPTDPEPVTLADPREGYLLAQVSRDGRWVVAAVSLVQPRPGFVRRLDDPDNRWRPFVGVLDATVAGVIVGDRYVAITDYDAPRGRLVAIPLEGPTPSDPSTWQELIPESDAVLRTVALVGGRLVLTELVDTFSRVRVAALDGRVGEEIPLPGPGALVEMPFPLMNLVPQGHPGEYLFAQSTLTSSPGLYRYRFETGTVVELEAPAAALEDAVVDSRWTTSADATRIPFHVVRRGATPDAAPRPTLIYGYGGFNAPLPPGYHPGMAAFVAAGGVFVHAHLRGGGEFGRTWWEAGRRANKQRGYEDLYAIAGRLIGDGITTPELLAVTGGSNGGLMAGVAAMQRPDLFAVSVPQKTLLDLIGACRDPYGRITVSLEFGDPEDPEDVERFAGYSPYQLVREDTAYPSIFLDAGATDPRCAPWHARKFAAAMQRVADPARPVLLRVWEDVGHGWSSGRQELVAQTSDWLSFIMRRLGMRPPAPTG